MVLLSHNGIDADLKIAARLSGIGVTLCAHTHDSPSQPVTVKNLGGQTIVTKACCHRKFLGVLDLDVKLGRVAGFNYRLLPECFDLLAADTWMVTTNKKSGVPLVSTLNQPWP
ncbi:hypothetical protein HC248_01246 [Polaromonas vacuolata]|uniref:Uncharacterized protein n=1 Tax=Polaromonas vacuolata TaxID=37448 RepID=A0A6H2H7V3_9BURK|nr:hypothetical protein [Polaromonas vacuolata]QJC55962.1 hypothetical protein HC248_01246 [Polaromonas vacuolata]